MHHAHRSSRWIGALTILLAAIACSTSSEKAAAPQPIARPAIVGKGSASVDARGGVVESSDGKAFVEIPAGAVEEGIQITVTPVEGPAGVDGPAYEFGPPGTQFKEPVLVGFTRPEITLEALRDGTVTPPIVSVYEDGKWLALPGSVDVERHSVIAYTTHFSTYGCVPFDNASCIPNLYANCCTAEVNGIPAGCSCAWGTPVNMSAPHIPAFVGDAWKLRDCLHRSNPPADPMIGRGCSDCEEQCCRDIKGGGVTYNRAYISREQPGSCQCTILREVTVLGTPVGDGLDAERHAACVKRCKKPAGSDGGSSSEGVLEAGAGDGAGRPLCSDATPCSVTIFGGDVFNVTPAYQVALSAGIKNVNGDPLVPGEQTITWTASPPGLVMLKPNDEFEQVDIEYKHTGSVVITASVPGGSDTATINISCGDQTCVRCDNDASRGVCTTSTNVVCCDGATLRWGSSAGGTCAQNTPVQDYFLRCP